MWHHELTRLLSVETAVNSMEQYMVLRPDNGSQDYVLFGQVYTNSKAVEADMEHLVS